MLGRLLLLFIIVPLVELFLLVKVAQIIHFWPTVGLVILTGMLGSFLVRWQGLRTLQMIRQDLSQGRMPAERILSGLLILLGGAFLITPGILTDLAGFALMVPGNRRLLVKYLKERIQMRIDGGGGSFFFFQTGMPGADGDVIDQPPSGDEDN